MVPDEFLHRCCDGQDEKVDQLFAANAVAASEYHLWMAFNLLDIDGGGQLDRSEVFGIMSELRRAALLPDLPDIQV